MRIIAGKWGGRRLPAPVPGGARPTSDRVREALASLLDARGLIEGALVLDLFAGTGACGLELLSRGAAGLLSVDRDVRAVQRNAHALGAGAEARGLRLDLLGKTDVVVARLSAALPAAPKLVLVDPPYAEVARTADLLGRLSNLADAEAMLVLEQRASDPVPSLAGWTHARAYRYGDTALGLFERASGAPSGRV